MKTELEQLEAEIKGVVTQLTKAYSKTEDCAKAKAKAEDYAKLYAYTKPEAYAYAKGKAEDYARAKAKAEAYAHAVEATLMRLQIEKREILKGKADE